MNLQDAHDHLLAHFSRLSSEREAEDYNVHAIEHDFDHQQVQSLKELLNTDLQTKRSADEKHWLVWVVAASEVGYQYDGVEYWDSFADFIPAWRQFGNRNVIRTCYQRFANQFRGHQPTGKWAAHFPIIAWPITHAVLPKYLQFLFVDHLFDLRTALSRRGEMTLNEIGELLLDRYYGQSSRFIGLLQQTALTSRIVLAMQMEDVSETASPIERSLLKRIVADVETRGRSKSRLRETRRTLKQTRFVNSARQPGDVGTIPSSDDSGFGVPIRPRIIAKHLDDEWRVSIVFPNLATPLRKAGLSPSDFSGSRMRFRMCGADGSWSPGRGLFGFDGSIEHEIERWPNSGKVLELESAPSKVANVIEDHIVLPWQFPILLKLRTDGTASEVLGKHIKPGNSYLILGQDAFCIKDINDLNSKSVRVHLKNTVGVQIEVPPAIGAQAVNYIKELGLGYLVSARIEPIGLTPRWDTVTGALIFDESQIPLFRISADMSVEEYQVTVDRQTTTRFRTNSKSEIIVALQGLNEGHHTVSIAAMRTASGSDAVAEEIDLVIRSPIPWPQSIKGKAGISLWTEPRDAEINELLDGTAKLRTRIPQGRSVRATMRYVSPDESAIREHNVGEFTSPLSSDQLDDIAHKLGSEQYIEDYEQASRVDLRISSGELGSSIISFEKTIEPVRWIWNSDDSIRLSDDTDGETPPLIEHYSLDSIDRASPISYDDALTGLSPSGSGGLFSAIHQRKRYSVIITCTKRTHSDFQSLSIPAQLSGHQIQPIKLLNSIKHWNGAKRLIGPMAFMAKRNAILSLRRSLERALCGEDWAKEVALCREGKKQVTDLYTSVNHSKGYASGIRRYKWRYNEGRIESEQEFQRLSKVYRICADEKLCRFALRLAFAPNSVRKSDLPDKNSIKLLQTKKRSLIRGAYYALLNTQSADQNLSESEAI